VDRPSPTVSELVRLAVEICDRDGRDAALGRFEEQLIDAPAPMNAPPRH
jgi:hypothetical protein